MGKRPAAIEMFEGNMGSIQGEVRVFHAKERAICHGNGT